MEAHNKKWEIIH